MILLITDNSPDYGADWLSHGLVELAGPGKVVDWPRKASLHWSVGEPQFDCCCSLDTARLSTDETAQYLRDGTFDLIVVPTLRGNVPQRLYFARDLFRRNADRIVYYDAEDNSRDSLPLFVDTVGFRPVAYFKRELPLGETWAQPLPFGYPAERAHPPSSARPFVGTYDAFLWEWVGDRLRKRLANELRKLQNFGVFATSNSAERMSVTTNNQRLRLSRLAVSPAGHGYQTNRHLGIVAAGCCPIIEGPPWVEFPDQFIRGVDCLYFKDEVECVDAVRDLIEQPEWALELAQAAQLKFLDHHTTKHRALTVWQSVHGTLNVKPEVDYGVAASAVD